MASFPCPFLLLTGQVDVVQAVAGEGAAVPEPGKFGLVALGFFAAVFFPFDVEFVAQDAGAFFAAGDVLGKKRADVPPHAIVQVGMPADHLGGERFPADENVVRWLAFQDQFEAGLQESGRGQTRVAASLAGIDGGLLSTDPVAEVGEGDFFETGVIEAMIIHESAEAVFVAVPDMPDKGTIVEDGTMLFEEFFPQPVLQRFGFAAFGTSGGEQCAEVELAHGVCKKHTESLGGGRFALGGGKAHDAIGVGKREQFVTALDEFPRTLAESHGSRLVFVVPPRCERQGGSRGAARRRPGADTWTTPAARETAIASDHRSPAPATRPDIFPLRLVASMRGRTGL